MAVDSGAGVVLGERSALLAGARQATGGRSRSAA